MNREKGRTIFVLSLFSIVFISLIVHLSYLQIFKSEDLKQHSHNKRLWINEENVLRGSIVDRNEHILAYSEKNEDSNKRYYKYGNLYSHIIGYSDRAYGKSGLELNYNNELLAISSNKALDEIKNLVLPHSIGNNLKLTIDHGLQEKARGHLRKKKGVIIAMNPKSGEIYTMVSTPDFNTRNLGDEWKDILENKDDPLVNRATQGLYPPGSIFKIITSAAALETPNLNLSYQCSGNTKIDGKVFNDYGGKGHGNIDLKEAFSKSCNSYYADKSLEIGKDRLGDAADRFMINKSIKFDLAVNKSKFDYTKKLQQTEIASAAYGQGKVLVTPLNMALMVASIANDGAMMRPILVKEVFDKNNNTIKEYRTEILSQSVTPEIAETMKEMMRETVKSGTGKKAQIKGIDVSGKTGTAQNSSGKDHGWFVGFAPYDNPQIALVVLIEEGGSTGGQIAAPIAKDIISYAINNISF